MSYTNADGVYVMTGVDQGAVLPQGSSSLPARRSLIIDIPDFTALGTTFGAANINPNAPTLPAGALIVDANLIMTAAATSGGSATLTIGTYNAAGTAIDADGIDATIALTAMDAIGEVVQCDGAQVNGTVTIGSAPAYVGLIYATAAFTAGAAKLIIDYQVY
jgi:hypothetical protein